MSHMDADSLQRFKDAQKADYETALREIRSGRKRSHWMWYIFPQIKGLGRTGISQYYSVQSLQEARDYMADETLGSRLVEISNALLSLDTSDPHRVFGSPDDMKLRSCMTLFEAADPKQQVFGKVLDKFYGGRRDRRTLDILKEKSCYMQSIKIEDLIGETTEYDKKQSVELKRPKSWCKSISAFANTAGGVLIFGIADDNTVIGLDHAEVDSEKISEIIKNRIMPLPDFNLQFYKTEDGKKLIILQIHKGEETPYYYTADGTTEAYIRIGNESVPAKATDLKRLVLHGRNSSFDSLPSSYSASDYSF